MFFDKLRKEVVNINSFVNDIDEKFAAKQPNVNVNFDLELLKMKDNAMSFLDTARKNLDAIGSTCNRNDEHTRHLRSLMSDIDEHVSSIRSASAFKLGRVVFDEYGTTAEDGQNSTGSFTVDRFQAATSDNLAPVAQTPVLRLTSPRFQAYKLPSNSKMGKDSAMKTPPLTLSTSRKRRNKPNHVSFATRIISHTKSVTSMSDDDVLSSLAKELTFSEK